ncbi:MAG: hypothetical protein SH848_03940 [Saprospiraceae bacterium]|nr:hypothetical protein [Saprospiraceae bacterium]MDZ4703052.1 hypothetical protein [Saprospiraceae bacterium]
MMQRERHLGRGSGKAPSPATDWFRTGYDSVTQIFVEVKFGMASRNCDNYGVCHVDAIERLWEYQTTSLCFCPGKARAIMSISENGDIEMVFPKSIIPPETKNNFFSKEFFEVKEDFKLSKKILDQYQIKVIPEILRGTYKVVETSGFYIIDFKKNAS